MIGAHEFSDLSSVKGLAEMALSLKRNFCPGYRLSNPDEMAYAIATRNMELFVRLQELPVSLYREEVLQMYGLLRWLDSGLPAFDLTHSLAAGLLLTDPSDVNASEIKLPFEAFIVRFPQPFWEIVGHTGRKWPVSLAIVHTYPFEDSYRLVTRLVSKAVKFTDRTQVWEVLMPLPEAGPVGPWTDMEFTNAAQPARQEEVLTTAVITIEDDDKHLAKAFRRLLVNLCLYVAEKGRGEPSRKSSSGKKSTSGEPVPEIWTIGREVKLDRELVASAQAWTAAQGRQKEGWALRSKFTVRGHWRNVAHGPGRTLHTRKWIAPYWKGQGPMMSHLYTMGDEK
jgi:hypothetical protein